MTKTVLSTAAVPVGKVHFNLVLW